jgi:hypothetical protein
VLTPTPTTTPGTACTGDCNDDNNVTVDELVRGVNIALGTADLDTCPSFDTSEDGQVTVNELVRAVNNALTGCVVAVEDSGRFAASHAALVHIGA